MHNVKTGNYKEDTAEENKHLCLALEFFLGIKNIQKITRKSSVTVFHSLCYSVIITVNTDSDRLISYK